VGGPGEVAVDFLDFGRLVYPRLVGTLVLCGMGEEAAVALIEAVVRREVREGLASGTEGTRLVVQKVLEKAVPPPVTRAPVDDVERALAPLPWGVRLATVSEPVLGANAGAVRKLSPPDPGRVPPEVLIAAVDARAPSPRPDLLRGLVRGSVRRWLKVAIPVAAVFVVGVIVVSIIVARASGRSGGGATITEWVAVLDVGPSARALYPAGAEVGKVAGVYMFVDRWACYDGFPPGTPTDRGDWFLGVAASDKVVVDDILERLGRTPVVLAQVEQGCPLPPDTTPVESRA
jgi:hypothetical protein